MAQKALKELLAEVDTSLQGQLTAGDRTTLQQTRADLQAALARDSSASAAPLGERLRGALERLEGEHPQLTGMLSKALDALSDLGV